jgi:CubicO group peptidase (beta-lactamase class C family)
MRDGLDFIEDYTVDAEGTSRSDVIGMLFGSGADDVFEYARSRPQSNSPGEVWSYSSGTTNIVCGLIGRVLGGRRAVEEFMNERLFSPLGMSSAVATFDEAGTFIGSSYVHATARDFARFGYLYVRGGIFAGHRVLDEQWVNSAHRQHAVDPDNGHGYGEHWWTWNADERTLAALGYEGQRLVVVPDRDLVLVHLGKWDIATQPHLDSILTQIIESVPLDGVEQPT